RETIKVVDFGIAKLRRNEPLRLTTTGAVLGTPQYMAPEQARGLEIDGRVDVHAVGVMLYEMLAGTAPYRGDNYNVVLFEILTGKPRPLRQVAPEIDPALERIVMRAFAPDLGKRIQSARELRAELEEFLFQPSELGPTVVDVPARPQVMSLGGTDDPQPGAALIAEQLWQEAPRKDTLPVRPPRTPGAG